jgi:hypothetical protein
MDPEAHLCYVRNLLYASWRPASFFQWRVQWHPDSHLRQIWHPLESLRRLVPRRLALDFQPRVRWHSEVNFVPNMGPCRCVATNAAHRVRRLLFAYVRFGVHVATIGVAALGVCFSTACQISSRGSSTLNLSYLWGVRLPASCLMVSRGFLGLLWILSRRTLGVVFPASCRIAFVGYSALRMVSNVGVATIGFATLLVGLPASFHIASRGFSWLGLLFYVSVATRVVTTLGLGYPASCLVASLGSCSQKCNLASASLRYASRLSASVCQRRVLWLPSLMFAACGILSRCHFAGVVACGFPGVTNLELASRRQTLLRSVSSWQRLVLQIHESYIRNLVSASRWQASRSSASICQRLVWCLH